MNDDGERGERGDKGGLGSRAPSPLPLLLSSPLLSSPLLSSLSSRAASHLSLPLSSLPPLRLGDGAGILVALPHAFLARVVAADCGGVALPPPSGYAVGQFFLPKDNPTQYAAAKRVIEK